MREGGLSPLENIDSGRPACLAEEGGQVLLARGAGLGVLPAKGSLGTRDLAEECHPGGLWRKAKGIREVQR